LSLRAISTNILSLNYYRGADIADFQKNVEKNLCNFTIFSENTLSANIAECANIAEFSDIADFFGIYM
jgi:hypothetical protein